MFLNDLFGKPKNKEIGERGEELPSYNEGYPDTYLPNGLCSRCNKQSSFEIVSKIPISFTGNQVYRNSGDTGKRDYIDQVAILECRSCNQRIVVIEEQYINNTPMRLNQEKGGVLNFRGFFWWPMNSLKSNEDIPNDISESYNEGVTCLAASCPRAATVMFRRTLEAITLDKGFKERTLNSSLEKMFNEGALPLSFKEWVSELRLVGNVGAHFDPLTKVEIKDAKDMQDFIEELINHVYIIPAQLERRRRR